MHDQCKQSCGLCPIDIPSNDSTDVEIGEDSCRNWLETCVEWAEKGNDKVDNLWYVH